MANQSGIFEWLIEKIIQGNQLDEPKHQTLKALLELLAIQEESQILGHIYQLLDWQKAEVLRKNIFYGWNNQFDGGQLIATIEAIRNSIDGASPANGITDARERVSSLTMAWLTISPTVNPPSLNIVLQPTGPLSRPLGAADSPWSVELKSVPNDLKAVITPPDDIKIVSEHNIPKIELLFHYMPVSLILIGQADSSHIAAKHIAIGFVAQFADGKQGKVQIVVDIEQAMLVINTKGADSFIAKLLPVNELKLGFGCRLVWSDAMGIHFQGSSKPEIKLPVHANIKGTDVKNLYLLARPVAGQTTLQNKLEFAGLTTLQGLLGPLTLVADRVGFMTEFDVAHPMAATRGDPLAPHFCPPTSITLALNGGGFQGGGILAYDDKNARYAGVLQLTFRKLITVTAIGILDTTLPSGKPGYALLMVISAEFMPLQLSFGFTLSGVGGLLALNRTVNLDQLRQGVRNNALDYILFPRNPLANSDYLLSDLGATFPPAPDHFIFSPMVKMGWGTPPLITIEAGLLIETPSPARFAIFGTLRIALPNEEMALVLFQVNFLGAINFERQELSFDATLYDSRILCFALLGDMAMRLRWGDDANFVLAVGGFHPAYEPPADLTGLERVTLALLGGDNPRLNLAAYLAITPNTVQFGAHIELYAAAWKFNVYGYLDFDTIFQFSPFAFTAEVNSALALRFGDSVLAAIQLNFILSGPTPWNARGTASFKVLFFTVHVRFDVTIGESQDTTLPDVAVMPRLKAALSDSRNWQAELPDRQHMLVTLRQAMPTPQAVIVHPFGTLRVSQREVPLDLTIQKVGNAKPLDGNRFRINLVANHPDTTGEALKIAERVDEEFAPAQFLEMSSTERLSRKAFEKWKGGVTIEPTQNLRAARIAVRPVEYERKIVDPEGDVPGSDWPQLPFYDLLRGCAAARSVLAYPVRSPLAPAAVSVQREAFAVVTTQDLKPYVHRQMDGQPDWQATSQSEAFDIMAQMIAQNPALTGKLQVVPMYEVNE